MADQSRGTRGPAPKSAADRWLTGTGPRPDDVAVATGGRSAGKALRVPRPPVTLGPAGRRLWSSLYRQLAPAGLLAETDLPALELLCGSYQVWHDATLSIKDDGAIVHDARGVPRKNAAVMVQRDSGASVYRLLAEFGCSPRSARLLGLEVDEGDGDDD